jgi:hypothetical protein
VIRIQLDSSVLYPHHKSTGTRCDFVPYRFRLSAVCVFGSGSSVADPHHFDEDPDPACHFDVDQDPTFHFDAETDPNTAFRFYEDPYPS